MTITNNATNGLQNVTRPNAGHQIVDVKNIAEHNGKKLVMTDVKVSVRTILSDLAREFRTWSTVRTATKIVNPIYTKARTVISESAPFVAEIKAVNIQVNDQTAFADSFTTKQTPAPSIATEKSAFEPTSQASVITPQRLPFLCRAVSAASACRRRKAIYSRCKNQQRAF
jgi:hypothetical protein